MSDPPEIDQIVQDILVDMPLKERAAIANLDEDKVPNLQCAFDTCIHSQLGKDDKISKDLTYLIRKVLQETLSGEDREVIGSNAIIYTYPCLEPAHRIMESRLSSR